MPPAAERPDFPVISLLPSPPPGNRPPTAAPLASAPSLLSFIKTPSEEVEESSPGKTPSSGSSSILPSAPSFPPAPESLPVVLPDGEEPREEEPATPEENGNEAEAKITAEKESAPETEETTEAISEETEETKEEKPEENTENTAEETAPEKKEPEEEPASGTDGVGVSSNPEDAEEEVLPSPSEPSETGENPSEKEENEYDRKNDQNDDEIRTHDTTERSGAAGISVFVGRTLSRWESSLRSAVRAMGFPPMRRGASSFPENERGRSHGVLWFLLTACVVVVLLGGTIFALVRHLQSSSWETLMEQGKTLYDAEDYSSAFDTWKQTAEKYPNRVEPVVGMAQAAEKMGQTELAIDLYHAGLEILPFDASSFRARLLCERGRLYVFLKDWESAQQNFESATFLDTTNFTAWFSLGAVLEERGRSQDALKAYRHALDLSPSSDQARESVARMTALLALSEESSAAAAKKQKYTEALQVGTVALKLRRYPEASQKFAEALAIRSDDAVAWLGFAEARQGLGDLAGAIKSCERALEKDPGNADAQSRLEALLREKSPQRKKPQPSSKTSSSKTKKPASDQ